MNLSGLAAPGPRMVLALVLAGHLVACEGAGGPTARVEAQSPAPIAADAMCPAPINDVPLDMEVTVPLAYPYSKLGIFNVYWGENWDSTSGNFKRADIEAALAAVIATPYFDRLCQYGVPGFEFHGSATTDGVVGCSRNPGTTTSTPSIFSFMSCEEYTPFTGVPNVVGLPNPACVACSLLPIDCASVAETIAEPPCLATPNPTGSRVYVVLLPKGTTIDDFGSRSCTAYNAYHFQIPSRALFSILPPFVIPGTQGRPLNLAIIPTECFGTIPQLIAAITHEVIEAATDPIPLEHWIDTSTASPGGSFDITQIGTLLKEGEVADICGNTSTEFTASDGTATAVARYWSNADNNCVSVDATPPVTTASLAPPPSAFGWNAAATTVTLSAADPGTLPSGVKEIVLAASGAQPIPATTTAGTSATALFTVEGVSVLTFHAVDNAGNVEADQSLTVRLDLTAPTIGGAAAPPPNGAGWNRTDVIVTFTCADAVSGIASCTPPVVLSAEGTNQAATGMAVDLAGNVATATVGGIDIDKTPPVITYTGNLGTYTVDQVVTIHCAATDTLSGVASTTCADLNQAAWVVGLGTHVLSATAVDRADNVGAGSTTFTVIVTPASLCNLTTMFASKPQIAHALCAKMDAVAHAATPQARAGQIGAYENQLAAQTGKAFTPEQAAVLRALADAL